MSIANSFKFLNILTSSPRRVAIGLGMLKFLRAVLAIYSVMLSAQFFGASLQRDAWVLGGTIASVLTQFLFGPLNEIFRAKFVHIREEEGEEQAVKNTSSVMGAVLAIGFLVIGICVFFPDFISKIFAPGFNAAERNVLSLMIRWMIPSLLLVELTYLWTSLLNAYDSFYIPDILAVISAFLNVIIILVFAPIIGIFSLIASTYLSLIILMVTLLKALKRKNPGLLGIKIPKWELMKPFILFSLPFYLPYFWGQVALSVERMLCTLLGVGSVSVLDYARRFIDMPSGIILGVVTSVLTPILANLFANGKIQEFDDEIMKFIKMVFLGITPLIVTLTVCSGDVINIFLLRGSFNASLAGQTAVTLMWFGCGVYGTILYTICGQAMVAKKNTSIIAATGFALQLLSITINLLVYKELGVITFAIAASTSVTLAGIFLFSRLHNFKEGQRNGDIVKLLIICAVAVFASYFLHGLTYLVLSSNTLAFAALLSAKIKNIIMLAVTVMSSIIIILSGLFIFNFREKNIVIDLFKKVRLKS